MNFVVLYNIRHELQCQEYEHSLQIVSALSDILETSLGKCVGAEENLVRRLLSKRSLLACSSVPSYQFDIPLTFLAPGGFHILERSLNSVVI
jgi:hypothetical protein